MVHMLHNLTYIWRGVVQWQHPPCEYICVHAAASCQEISCPSPPVPVVLSSYSWLSPPGGDEQV